MGDCVSRPKEAEENAHSQLENHSNDAEFIYKPALHGLSEYSDKAIKTADDQELASKQLLSINQELPNFQSALASLAPEKACTTSKLLIEIQKGKGITPSIPCFYKPKPFVQIELFPTKITYSSSVNNLHIPTWYQLYSHTMGIKNIEKIIVRVKFQKDFGKDELFGVAEIKFSELDGQKVVEEWFELKCKGEVEKKAFVKLRIQAIVNEAELVKENMKKYEEIIKEANEVRARLENKLKRCEEVIGPEGRG